jgi:hypothetical protein
MYGNSVLGTYKEPRGRITGYTEVIRQNRRCLTVSESNAIEVGLSVTGFLSLRASVRSIPVAPTDQGVQHEAGRLQAAIAHQAVPKMGKPTVTVLPGRHHVPKLSRNLLVNARFHARHFVAFHFNP